MPRLTEYADPAAPNQPLIVPFGISEERFTELGKIVNSVYQESEKASEVIYKLDALEPALSENEWAVTLYALGSMVSEIQRLNEMRIAALAVINPEALTPPGFPKDGKEKLN